jgi:hypothetical protein
MSITVFDNHTLELNKYPRFYTDKEITDKIMITFFMNEEYLKNLSNSYENSIKYHNECKEYFYVFKSIDKKLVKKYSSKEIIQLINGINDFLRINNDIKKQINFLKNINKIDLIYYFYIKNNNFYMNLFKAVEQSKLLYFQSRDFTYIINPPIDFYNNKNSSIYSALEIMEIYAYTQYLISNKIIKELPEPIYLNL